MRSKITNIVTDNAAIMISAFSLPGFSGIFDNDMDSCSDSEDELEEVDLDVDSMVEKNDV